MTVVRKVSDEGLNNLSFSPFMTCEIFEALCARNSHAVSCWVSSSFLRCVYLQGGHQEGVEDMGNTWPFGTFVRELHE